MNPSRYDNNSLDEMNAAPRRPVGVLLMLCGGVVQEIRTWECAVFAVQSLWRQNAQLQAKVRVLRRNADEARQEWERLAAELRQKDDVIGESETTIDENCALSSGK